MANLFQRIRAGIFPSGEKVDAQYYGGGEVRRPTYVAAALNSSYLSGRPGSEDVFGDVDFSYLTLAPMENRPPQFQYVEGAGYAGLVPSEVQPEIPRFDPWE